MLDRAAKWWTLVTVLGVTLILATLWPLGDAIGADERLLRWTFKPGEKLAWKVNQEMKAPAGEGKQDGADMQTNFAVETVKADKQKTILRIRLVHINMKILQDGDEDPIVIDSDKLDDLEGLEDLAAEPIRLVMRLAYLVQIDGRGAVSDLSIERMKPEEDEVEDLQVPQESLLKQLFSKKGFNQPRFGGWPLLPEEPVAVGTSWPSDVPLLLMPQVPALKHKYIYRYEGTEKIDGRDLDKLSLQGELLETKTETLNKRAAISVTVPKYESRGTIYFDPRVGRMVRSEFSERTTIAPRVLGKDTPPGEMTITVKSSLTPAPEDEGASR